MNGVKVGFYKTGSGGGRKRATWVKELYDALIIEFERLRECGVKFNMRLIWLLALKLMTFDDAGLYGNNQVDVSSGNQLQDMVTSRCIQRFMQCKGVVCPVQTGKI